MVSLAQASVARHTRVTDVRASSLLVRQRGWSRPWFTGAWREAVPTVRSPAPAPLPPMRHDVIDDRGSRITPGEPAAAPEP
jgi:hypothetical protein